MKSKNRKTRAANKRRAKRAQKAKKRAATRKPEKARTSACRAMTAYYGYHGHTKGLYCCIHRGRKIVDRRHWVLSDDDSRRTAVEEIASYAKEYGASDIYTLPGVREPKYLPGAYAIISGDGFSSSPFADGDDPEIMGPDDIWDIVDDAIGGPVTDIKPIHQLNMNNNESSLIPIERVETQYRTNAELRRAHDDLADIEVGKTTITLAGHRVICLKSIENRVLSLTFMGKPASGVERVLLIGRYTHRRNTKVWYETIDSASKIYRDEVYEVLAFDYQEPPAPYSLLFTGPKAGLYSDIMRDLIMLHMICVLNFAKKLQGVDY